MLTPYTSNKTPTVTSIQPASSQPASVLTTTTEVKNTALSLANTEQLTPQKGTKRKLSESAPLSTQDDIAQEKWNLLITRVQTICLSFSAAAAETFLRHFTFPAEVKASYYDLLVAHFEQYNEIPQWAERHRFIRRQSTYNAIAAIKSHQLPALEKNPPLKEKILSALKDIGRFNHKANRRDVPTNNFSEEEESINVIRQAVDAKLLKMPTVLREKCKDGDIVTLQKMASQYTAETYKEKENTLTSDSSHIDNESEYQVGLPTYCGEITDLIYYSLCEKGVKPEKMRVCTFTQKATKGCEEGYNHLLIIYSSDPHTFKEMALKCGIGDKKTHDHSYANFIDICLERDKTETFFIIDAWSKDNKIVDLGLTDEALLSVIKERFPAKKDPEIEKIYLKVLMDGLLTESDVSTERYDEHDFVDFSRISVCIDEPIDYSDSDSDSDDSLGFYAGAGVTHQKLKLEN